MQFSDTMLDRYAAPYFSQFTAVNIPDLSEATAGAERWPARHLLTSTTDELTGKTVGNPVRQWGVNMLYRARNAALAYTRGREFTLQCLSEPWGSDAAVTAYYAALPEWEQVLGNIQVACEILRKGYSKGKSIYARGDGSIYERTNLIANAVKHGATGGAIGTDGPGLPMWLSNDGFQTVEAALSWEELAEWVRDLITTAKDQMTSLHVLAANS